MRDSIADMVHTLVYFGWYSHGFRHFHAGQTRYWKKADSPDEPPAHSVVWPSSKFDGIRFGFFDGADKEFLLVSADEVVLAHPVLFVPCRHGVGAPGPRHQKLDDNAAAAILVDMIVANAAFRDALARKLRRLAI